eukprot:829527-Amphidinium_carterae.1
MRRIPKQVAQRVSKERLPRGGAPSSCLQATKCTSYNPIVLTVVCSLGCARPLDHRKQLNSNDFYLVRVVSQLHAAPQDYVAGVQRHLSRMLRCLAVPGFLPGLRDTL